MAKMGKWKLMEIVDRSSHLVDVKIEIEGTFTKEEWYQFKKALILSKQNFDTSGGSPLSTKNEVVRLIQEGVSPLALPGASVTPSMEAR